MRQTDERVKIVRRTLADGTVREYRYDKLVSKPRRVVPPSTCCWRILADRFEKASEWDALAIKTRIEYRRTFGLAEAYWPFMTMAELGDRRLRADLYEFRDSFKKTPVMADKHIRHICSLLEWAYDRGLIEMNHARRIKPLTVNRRPRAEIVIDPAQREALFAAAEDDFRDVMLGAWLTGLRQGDLCALDWKQIGEDGTIVVQPSKTKRKRPHLRLWLPTVALPPLARLIEKRREVTGGSGLIFTRASGRPWSHASIDYRWQPLKRRVLGDADIHWHDWRGTLVGMLTEAGCTNPQIASITGHSVGADEGGHGTALASYQARTRALSIGAFTALAKAMGEITNVPRTAILRAL